MSDKVEGNESLDSVNEVEKTSESAKKESTINNDSKQDTWKNADHVSRKDDIDPSEVEGLKAIDSFGIVNEDGSTTVAKRHDRNVKDQSTRLKKLEPKYDHSKPAEKKEPPKKIREYVEPPSDDPRPVSYDAQDRRLKDPIEGFIPQRADYLGFKIQRYPNVTDEQIQELHQMILRIPENERKALQSIGVSFSISEYVKDARPEDHHKEGRTAGTELDKVQGFFEPDTHQIVLPMKEEIQSNSLWSVSSKHREFSTTFFHEVGHALDKYSLDYAHSEDFVKAYKKDLLNLVNEIKKSGDTSVYDRLRYHIDPELSDERKDDPNALFDRQRVGREEMFAELYSVIRTPEREHTDKMKLLRKSFPSVHGLMEHSLERFNADSA